MDGEEWGEMKRDEEGLREMGSEEESRGRGPRGREKWRYRGMRHFIFQMPKS